MNKNLDPYIKTSKLRDVKTKKREEEFKKKPKHASSIPGRGMKIVGGWFEEDYFGDTENDLSEEVNDQADEGYTLLLKAHGYDQ